jgi:hypothetical protein
MRSSPNATVFFNIYHHCEVKSNPSVYPVVALDSALGFIKSLPIEERPLNQCHLLDQSIGDL